MPQNFSLASVIPEADTFTDMDEAKSVYNVRSAKTFSAIEYAELGKIERMMLQAQSKTVLVRKEKNPDKQQAMLEEAARALTETIDQAVHFLIPDMPMERVREIEFAGKMAFFEAWKSWQPVSEPPDPKAPATRVTRGRRSRTLSASTASTPSGS